jgi:hypothetical protein
MKSTIKNKFLIFLFGLATNFKIEFIGKLFGAEIIALFTLPFFFIKKIFISNPHLKKYLLFLLCLFFFQVVSDFLNNTMAEDYLRGWAVILFSMILLCYLVTVLSQDTNNIIYYLLGSSLSQYFFQDSLDYYLFLDPSENTNFFKSTFMLITDPIILVISFFLHKRGKIFAPIFLLICSFFYAYYDARANALCFLLSSLTLFFLNRKVKISSQKLIIGLLAILVLFYISYCFYIYYVLSGQLTGTNSQNQVRLMSNPYNPFELLLYGRGSTLPLIEAIKDRFLLGFGSWAKDPGGYYAQFIPFESLSVADKMSLNTSDLISAHSVLLGYWVYSGFFGFFAIFLVFINFIRDSLRLFQSGIRIPILPILLVLFFHELWSFLFSPTQIIRTELPIFLSLLIIETSRLKSLSNKTFPLIK